MIGADCLASSDELLQRREVIFAKKDIFGSFSHWKLFL